MRKFYEINKKVKLSSELRSWLVDYGFDEQSGGFLSDSKSFIKSFDRTLGDKLIGKILITITNIGIGFSTYKKSEEFENKDTEYKFIKGKTPKETILDAFDDYFGEDNE